jgi:hypothetical protein
MKNVVFWDIKPSSYLTGDTLHLRYRAQPVKCYVRFEVFSAMTMKNAVFWDIKPSSYLTGDTLHLATETSQLMLCMIWGFHGSDYEKFRLQGYKNPIRISQETHYVCATEPSPLMIRRIWGFHGCDYEECRLLGCYVVRLLQEPTYRGNVCLHHHGEKNHRARNFIVNAVPSSLISFPWRWRRYVPAKCLF